MEGCGGRQPAPKHEHDSIVGGISSGVVRMGARLGLRIAEHKCVLQIASHGKLPLELVRQQQVVGVKELNELSLSQFSTSIPRGACALIGPSFPSYAIAERANHGEATVRGTVIDNDNFLVRVRLPKCALNCLADVLFGIEARNDDANEWGAQLIYPYMRLEQCWILGVPRRPLQCV